MPEIVLFTIGVGQLLLKSVVCPHITLLGEVFAIVVETAESTVIVGRCYLYYSEACIASYLQSNNVLSTFISRILPAVRCLFRRIKIGDAW